MFLLALSLARAKESKSPDSLATVVQVFPLADTRDLEESGVKAEAVEYKGRKAVRVTVPGPDEGLAFLRGTEFDDGTIEADVALKVTTPAGMRNPGFIGIAFRTRPDARHYDLFYIRPGNAAAEDQAMRNHSTQYVAKPDFDWYRLRRAWPSVYEAYTELQPETWTRIRIEVAGRIGRLYVNGSASPGLVVDGLKGEDLTGRVGLWAGFGQESYFSNVRVTHAKRQPVENGAEADGTWEVKYSTDVGNYSSVMKLRRDAGTISGTATGLLGSDLPVSGTWRNGYVELTFRGTWSGPGGDPAVATASLSGWIDGNGAKGRVSVSGRADGVWTATKRE